MRSKQLPNGWKWIKLEDICQNVDSVKRKEKNAEDELLYLDIGGIDNFSNKIYSHKTYKWKDAPSRAQQIVFKNDILFSTVRTYMKNIAVVENKIYDGQIASSGFCVIRSDKKIMIPKFVFYYIISQDFLRPLNELQTGSSYPAVRDRDVFLQPFPLAPKSAQQAIVSKIDELFSELDRGLEDLRSVQQQLKIYRQSVLKWAFEGKLTNENVKDGELPKRWKEIILKDVAKIVSGFAFKSSAFITKGIPVVKISNVGYSEFVWKDQQYLPKGFLKSKADFILRGGDLLIALTRPITNNTTKICKYPFDIEQGLLNQRVACIKDLKIDNSYLYMYLQTEGFKKYIRTKFSETLQPNLSPKDLALTTIPFCSIDEQNKIVQEIESRLSVADKIEESITQSLQQAEALRQSILKKAFEGKLICN